MDSELKRLRLNLGMTQGEMARRMGVSQATISELERGITKHPRATTILEAARVLKVESMHSLIKGRKKVRQVDSPDLATEMKIMDVLTSLHPADRKTWISSVEALANALNTARDQSSSEPDENAPAAPKSH